MQCSNFEVHISPPVWCLYTDKSTLWSTRDTPTNLPDHGSHPNHRTGTASLKKEEDLYRHVHSWVDAWYAHNLPDHGSHPNHRTGTASLKKRRRFIQTRPLSGRRVICPQICQIMVPIPTTKQVQHLWKNRIDCETQTIKTGQETDKDRKARLQG